MADGAGKFLLGWLLLVLLAVALPAGWLMLSKPSAPASGRYGAIALSQASLAYGASWGYPDVPSADQRALKECGRTDCAVRTNLAGTCGTLVMSAERNQSFVIADSDRNSAAALALAQCEAQGASDCAVKVNICGTGP
ncbi:MAG TPA: DUF4189 domain-containing protein [Rhizomicrobium sp.]|jgi:hypothetical protein|nr:DUF4189 domain-containing protein [Rhizomicrobium sp.]